MKTAMKETTYRDKNGNTWKGATAKGALVWGSFYSTATSGAAVYLDPMMTGSTLAFGDVFMDSLIIFPSAGAAQGLAKWRMAKARNEGPDELDKFTSKAVKKHKHPIRFKKAA